MTTTIKVFKSADQGAPIVSNNWGDLTAMLDACLINGYNLKTIDGITSDAGVATATITSGHLYTVGQVLLIAGADQAAYNGEQVITATTSSTVSFAVAGSPASPATTQTVLSIKVAPLGFEVAFTGTNKRAYRSVDPASPRHCLRVDDGIKAAGYDTSWAKWANVGVCESMTDIDTIVGAQAPFDPNHPAQNWTSLAANQFGWHKWVYAHGVGYDNYPDGGSGARNWVLIGDARTFFLFVTASPGYTWSGYSTYMFGDPISFKAGDQYGTMLLADDSLVSMNGGDYWSYTGQRNGYGLVQSLDMMGKVMLRNYTQIGNPIRWGVTSLNIDNTQQICGRGSMPFPNGPDFSLWLLPVYIRQEDGHMRGLMPGMRWVPQNRPYAHLTVVDNVLNEAGRKFLLVRTQYSNEFEGAQVAFDITGPWR